MALPLAPAGFFWRCVYVCRPRVWRPRTVAIITAVVRPRSAIVRRACMLFCTLVPLTSVPAHPPVPPIVRAPPTTSTHRAPVEPPFYVFPPYALVPPSVYYVSIPGGGGSTVFNPPTQDVPEPGTLVLFVAALLMLLRLRRVA